MTSMGMRKRSISRRWSAQSQASCWTIRRQAAAASNSGARSPASEPALSPANRTVDLLQKFETQVSLSVVTFAAIMLWLR